MKLALARGVSHAELLRTTSALEIGEYRALDMIDPLFIGQRLEAAIAGLTSTMFNLWRPEGVDSTTASDWIPDYTAWLTAKTADELSDEYDRWREKQIEKGIIQGES